MCTSVRVYTNGRLGALIDGGQEQSPLLLFFIE